MAKKKLSELSPEEEAAASMTHEERAAKFFEENENYPHDKIIVTDDGQIFPATLKGDNAAFNYSNEKKVGFKTIEKA